MCGFERSRMNSSNRNTVDFFRRRREDQKEEILGSFSDSFGSSYGQDKNISSLYNPEGLDLDDLLESANLNSTLTID